MHMITLMTMSPPGASATGGNGEDVEDVVGASSVHVPLLSKMHDTHSGLSTNGLRLA